MDAPSGKDVIAQVGKEYLGQVVRLYESESKTLRTLLSGLVVFGGVFVFLVLLPFVRMHYQHQAVAARLRELGAEADGVASTLAVYRQAVEGFSRLREAVGRGPGELRDSLPALLSSHGGHTQLESNAPMLQMAQRVVPVDPCGAPSDGAAWASCRVSARVRRQFEGYRALLHASVLAPIQTLPSSAAGLDVGALTAGLDSLQAAFEAQLAENPRFWERFSGKTDFFARLRGNLEQFWRRYGFEARRVAVEAERARLDSVTAGLVQRQAALEAGEKELAARLAEIESPLGKLPVGLVEAVQIFPVLMAVGLVWCVVVLHRVVALRQAAREGSRQQTPELADLTERHLTLVAPLWVDRGNSALGLMLLLLPIGIFVAACLLVAYHWTLEPASQDVLVLDPWVYGGLYALAAVGLYVAARRGAALLRTLREQAR